MSDSAMQCGPAVPLRQLEASVIEDAERMLEALKAIRSAHRIWQNPLLAECRSGLLSLDDFRLLFGQYWYYSRNFTKLIAAALVNCDDDLHRSQLSANLWEESGGRNLDERHAELYRRFLSRHLGVEPLERLRFEPYAVTFFEDSLAACLRGTTLEAAAFLSFGTEGIVPELYAIFVEGLRATGLPEEALTFFTIHMGCDDAHAETLERIALSYAGRPDWLAVCERSMVLALDIRDRFLTAVYHARRDAMISALIGRLSAAAGAADLAAATVARPQRHRPLYRNTDAAAGIAFEVERIAVAADVLDPRLLTVAPGYRNESHRHAHETFMYVLSGEGEVCLGSTTMAVSRGDVVFVPRWVPHHTRNLGPDDLQILAVTDFGLTSRFPGNTEGSYRQRPV